MFTFRLEKILAYKHQQLQLLEQELQLQQQQLSRAEAHLQDLQNEAQLADKQHVASQGSVLLGDHIDRRRLAYHALEQSIARQKCHLADIMTAVETARQKLLEARQEKDVLERLRSRAYEHYLQGLSRREQRLIDDITTMRSSYGNSRDSREDRSPELHSDG